MGAKVPGCLVTSFSSHCAAILYAAANSILAFASGSAAIKARRAAVASAARCVFDDGIVPFDRDDVIRTEVTSDARAGTVHGKWCTEGVCVCVCRLMGVGEGGWH